MSIVKMNSVMILGRLENLDPVIRVCFEQGCFHPEDAATLTQDDRRYTRLAENNPYQETLTKITELAKSLGHELSYNEQKALPSVEEAEVTVEVIHLALDTARQDISAIKRRIEFCESALATLNHMGNLDIDLDDLFAARMLQLRFGRLPIDNFPKLHFYREKLFIFMELDRDSDYCWGMVFSVEGAVAETDAILSSLSFERLWVSEELHGTPEEAKTDLSHELVDLYNRLQAVEQRLNQASAQYGSPLDGAYSRITSLYQTHELRRYMVNNKDLFLAVGFVPEEKASTFAAAFSSLSDVSVEIGEAEGLKNLSPPTQLRNHPFVRPMEFFVSLYGLPGYRDLDPTVFLGLTYMLLFGIMFGDVGQGIVIALLGLFLGSRSMALGPVLTRLGLSSALFGFLYGSVFGYEHALDFFYVGLLGMHEKPLEVMHPETMTQILIVAVSLGAVLLLLSMLANTFTAILQRDVDRALFSQNGIPGVVFYTSVLAVIGSMFIGGPDLLGNPIFVLLCLVLPLVIIFFKEPLSHRFAKRHHYEQKSHAAFSPIEAFFELFEVLLGFTTNTISFLRVGGFVLSHAGMMAVVMILADMFGGVGSIVVVIIGNIFVMVLEGIVCGIQVLRLQFYELFSHYFAGGGKPYNPVGY